jgi:hypothetical protein
VVRADERQELERLCLYIKPASHLGEAPVAHADWERLLPVDDAVRDGATHVIFQPLDLIARLAALVPKPRLNLTRFHGVTGTAKLTRAGN